MAERQIKISVDIISGSGGTTKVKGSLHEIDSEVKRINKATADDAKRTQKVIAESTKSRVNEEIKEEKRVERERKKTANDFIASIKRVESEGKASAGRMNTAFSSAFKGGFVGGLVGAMSLQLAKLPSMFKSTLDEMVTIAAERQNAFKGLESIATFKGIDSAAAQDAVKNLRFVKTGIIEVGDGVTALKNLLATGFSLPQAITLMERFSDSSAFGKQAALSYGDAVRSATEGIKNQNSILVDNAGVTKNISVILKEAGFEMEDLSSKTKSQNALLALYNGLLTETQGQVGDADKLTQGFTGSTAALTTAQNNLYAAIGKQIIQSPELLALIQTITQEINHNTDALQDNETQSTGHKKTLVSNFAEIGLEAVILGNNIKFFYEGLGRTLGMLATAIGTTVMSVLSAVPAAVQALVVNPINAISDGLNAVIQGMGGLGGISMPRIPDIPTANAFQTGVQMLKFQYQDFDKFVKNSQETDQRLRENYNTNFQRNLSNTPNAGALTGLPRSSTSSPSTIAAAGGGSGRGSSLTGGGQSAFTSNRQAAAFGKAMARLSPGLKAQIIQAAEYYGIPEALALAQLFSESTFKTTAQSPYNKGVGPAYGLTQQVVGTASRVMGRKVSGEELKRNPELALTAWGRYMSELFDRYGDWELATLAYHQGEGTVDKLVALLDKGKSSESFFRSRPKGKAYLNKISSLASLGGSSRYTTRESKGDPLGMIQHQQTDILGVDALIPRDTEIYARQAAAYRDLSDALWELTQHTHAENIEREISLGLYRDLNPEVTAAARNVAKLRDEHDERKRLADERKKADDEAQDALEKYRDEQRRLFGETEDFFRNKLDALVGGGFKGLWESILSDMKRSFIDKASNMLARLFSGAGATTTGQPQQGGFGGIFGGLFGGGGFGGGGMGPGGTPNFNPNNFAPAAPPTGQGGWNQMFGGGGEAGHGGMGGRGGWLEMMGGGSGQEGASSGGSFWSQLTGAGGMLGPRNNMLTGKMSGLGGKMGGIGDIAAMAGGLIGGRFGRVLSYAGMGASIGSMAGPWGAVIGAGIGAIVGLFGKKDDAIKKLKEAAISQFGITVKDKNVLEQLKAIGESMFGKGRVGPNAISVVKSEEGQNILRAYAESTGQSSIKIDRLNYGDENWSGNQFRSQFGGFGGGSGSSGSFGGVSSYTPSGYTVAQRSSGGGSYSGGGDSGRGTNTPQVTQMIGALMETLDGLKEEIGRLQGVSPGDVVAMGAPRASRQIADAYEGEMENDGQRNLSLGRLRGEMV